MNSIRNIACPRFPAKIMVQNYFTYFNNLSCQEFILQQKWFSSTPTRLSSGHIPKNVIADLSTAQYQKDNGAIYDKKPFKIELIEGKRYSWCLCGKSKSQPLCDGTHKLDQYKITLRPIRFQVEKTGTYWLCNCKQTKNRPFCDGTHKSEHIQKITGK